MTHRAQITLMQIGAAPNGLQGEPRLVRVTTRNVSEFSRSAPVVREEVRYLPGGQILERIFCRNDGSISYRWSHEYDPESGVKTIRTLDNQGNLVTANVERTVGDKREDVLSDASGVVLEITTTTNDALARTTESTTIDASGVRTAYFIVHCDENNQPLHGETLVGDDGWRFSIQLESGVKKLQVTHLDGTPLMESEFKSELDPALAPSSTYSPGEYLDDFSSSETVTKVDSRGNWIKKLRKSGNDDAGTVLIERDIKYYPDKQQ